jgi:hypothetical protein
LERALASTSPARIDDELYSSAKAVGAVMSRSASQQIAHWARIGRELEAAGSVSSRAVRRVLTGRDDYDNLGPHEQAVVRGEWAERMAEQLADLNFEREFSEDGAAYAELDKHGRAILREPTRKA